MSLFVGQVIHVHPAFRTAELVNCQTAQRFQNVPICHDFVSSNSGTWMAHAAVRPGSEQEAGGLMVNKDDRTVLAVCALVSGRPIILGFLPHPLTQLAFIRDEQNRDLYRHPSGTLATVNKAGNLEVQHTGGMFLRVSTDKGGIDPVQHEDLAPRAANLNWALPINDEPTVTLSNNLFRLVQKPDGDTEMLSGGSLTITFEDNLKVTIGGNADVTVNGNATATVGGDLKARALGDVTATAGGAGRVLAMGNGYLASSGAALVGSLASLTLEAPTVNVVANTFNVTATSVGIGAATVGIGATSIGMSAGAIGMTAANVGMTGTVGITGILGVTGVAAALDFTIGGFGGAAGFGGGGGGSFGGVAAQIAVAQAQVAAGQASVAQATSDIAAAVQACTDTSAPAKGTAPADNEGLSSDPAPDMP